MLNTKRLADVSLEVSLRVLMCSKKTKIKVVFDPVSERAQMLCFYV